jgi:hypothetical protein
VDFALPLDPPNDNRDSLPNAARISALEDMSDMSLRRAAGFPNDEEPGAKEQNGPIQTIILDKLSGLGA